MTKLRKLARGQPCQIMLPGSEHNTETTVLAHYRLAGISGIGMKSPDIIGAWSCFDCHEYVDFRREFKMDLAHMSRKELEAAYVRAYVKLAHAEGAFKTQVEVLNLEAA